MRGCRNRLQEEARKLQCTCNVAEDVYSHGPAEFRLLPPFSPLVSREDMADYEAVFRLLGSAFPKNKMQLKDAVYNGRKPSDPSCKIVDNNRYDACLVAGLWLGCQSLLVCGASLRINLPQAEYRADSRLHVQILFQATSAEHQRRGLGRLLTRCILRAAADAGHEVATVVVGARDVEGYWTKMGFVRPTTDPRVAPPLSATRAAVYKRATEEGEPHAMRCPVWATWLLPPEPEPQPGVPGAAGAAGEADDDTAAAVEAQRLERAAQHAERLVQKAAFKVVARYGTAATDIAAAGAAAVATAAAQQGRLATRSSRTRAAAQPAPASDPAPQPHLVCEQRRQQEQEPMLAVPAGPSALQAPRVAAGDHSCGEAAGIPRRGRGRPRKHALSGAGATAAAAVAAAAQARDQAAAADAGMRDEFGPTASAVVGSAANAARISPFPSPSSSPPAPAPDPDPQPPLVCEQQRQQEQAPSLAVPVDPSALQAPRVAAGDRSCGEAAGIPRRGRGRPRKHTLSGDGATAPAAVAAAAQARDQAAAADAGMRDEFGPTASAVVGSAANAARISPSPSPSPSSSPGRSRPKTPGARVRVTAPPPPQPGREAACGHQLRRSCRRPQQQERKQQEEPEPQLQGRRQQQSFDTPGPGASKRQRKCIDLACGEREAEGEFDDDAPPPPSLLPPPFRLHDGCLPPPPPSPGLLPSTEPERQSSIPDWCSRAVEDVVAAVLAETELPACGGCGGGPANAATPPAAAAEGLEGECTGGGAAAAAAAGVGAMAVGHRAASRTQLVEPAASAACPTASCPGGSALGAGGGAAADWEATGEAAAAAASGPWGWEDGLALVHRAPAVRAAAAERAKRGRSAGGEQGGMDGLLEEVTAAMAACWGSRSGGTPRSCAIKEEAQLRPVTPGAAGGRRARWASALARAGRGGGGPGVSCARGRAGGAGSCGGRADPVQLRPPGASCKGGGRQASARRRRCRNGGGGRRSRAGAAAWRSGGRAGGAAAPPAAPGPAALTAELARVRRPAGATARAMSPVPSPASWLPRARDGGGGGGRRCARRRAPDGSGAGRTLAAAGRALPAVLAWCAGNPPLGRALRRAVAGGGDTSSAAGGRARAAVVGPGRGERREFRPNPGGGAKADAAAGGSWRAAAAAAARWRRGAPAEAAGRRVCGGSDEDPAAGTGRRVRPPWPRSAQLGLAPARAVAATPGALAAARAAVGPTWPVLGGGRARRRQAAEGRENLRYLHVRLVPESGAVAPWPALGVVAAAVGAACGQQQGGRRRHLALRQSASLSRTGVLRAATRTGGLLQPRPKGAIACRCAWGGAVSAGAGAGRQCAVQCRGPLGRGLDPTAGGGRGSSGGDSAGVARHGRWGSRQPPHQRLSSAAISASGGGLPQPASNPGEQHVSSYTGGVEWKRLPPGCAGRGGTRGVGPDAEEAAQAGCRGGGDAKPGAAGGGRQSVSQRSVSVSVSGLGAGGVATVKRQRRNVEDEAEGEPGVQQARSGGRPARRRGPKGEAPAGTAAGCGAQATPSAGRGASHASGTA
ncbi:hypothetical protein PLESTM_000922300 [Pleodorina starrii]|nr:hypothetical protein PLESTM_000922300 [Pleodorina starrii]